MTYLTNKSDNITLHFFNPAWAKSSEYIQKVYKTHDNVRGYEKSVTHRKEYNTKLVEKLSKPTTASTLHSTNGAWVPTAEQLGKNAEIYQRRKVVIADADNYKKPKLYKLKDGKKQELIVQRLCRPTVSSSMHKTEKNEKLKKNPVFEAIKNINDKRRKITIVNIGLPSVTHTESKILRSFNPWIDENPFVLLKIPDKNKSDNQEASKNVKKNDKIIDTTNEKPSNRNKKSTVNKIREHKKKMGKSTQTKQSMPKSKEEIYHGVRDSLSDSKPLNKPLNLHLDVRKSDSRKPMAPIKVKLINMDKRMRNMYKWKIAKYEEILNSMLVESLEKFEFSFEKK